MIKLASDLRRAVDAMVPNCWAWTVSKVHKFDISILVMHDVLQSWLFHGSYPSIPEKMIVRLSCILVLLNASKVDD